MDVFLSFLICKDTYFSVNLLKRQAISHEVACLKQ
jgi:hypothetical protein